jgi:ABC-type dipeptide/oligopeptide/nickel transport system permease component
VPTGVVSYIVQRLVFGVFSMLGATLIAFLALQLAPGDPLELMAGSTRITPEVREAWRHRYGLDRPLPVQYLIFVKNALRGDFGTSYHYIGKPVSEMLAEGIPVTARWQALGLLVAIGGAVPMGVISALRQNSWVDNLFMFFAMLGASLPSFALATFLIVGISLRLGWLPVAGLSTPSHYILPALTLAAEPAALLTRMMRSSVLETMGQDYIRTARAKGLGEWAVITRHTVRNAMLPSVTVIGVIVGRMLAGSFIVETIFNIPGLGRIGVTAVLQRDYPVVLGTTILLAAVFILVTIMTDVLYVFLDPRIRLS